MAEEDSRRTAIPFPALIAIAIAVGGTALLFTSLTSSRPPLEGGPMYGSIGHQDVEARLWQDPFWAVAQKRPKYSARRRNKLEWSTNPGNAVETINPHDLADLKCQIQARLSKPGKDAKDLLILPVLVATGPYAELAEQRLRTRVAILEALAVSGYEPEDGDHLGYLEIGWDWNEYSPDDNAFEQIFKAARGDVGSRPLVIPYEWCVPATLQMAGAERPATQPTPKPYAGVLVLWLSADAVCTDLPLARSAAIKQVIDQDSHPSIHWKIIGPPDSDALKRIVDESECLACADPRLSSALLLCIHFIVKSFLLVSARMISG